MTEWRAQPKQFDFLTANEFCVLYGGARGGGKTDAELIDLITTCMEYPGAQTVLIRREFSELNKLGAAIPRSHELLEGTATWREKDHTWSFENGSVLEFGHLSDSKAIHKYLGAQYHKIAVDQAEELWYDEFNRLKGSLRGRAIYHYITGEPFIPCMRITANPGGIGQSWIKSLFIDAAPENSRYWVDSREEQPVISHKAIPHAQTYKFIPAKVWDNQELLKVNPGYIDQLYSVGGALARAWVNGDWSGFAGQFFDEFRKDRHTIKPFKIPADWPKWHSTDWGYANPSCTLWFARAAYSAKLKDDTVIPKGTLVVYRERYEVRQSIPDQALTIRTWSGQEQFRNQLLDPACWGQYDVNGLTFAEQYARNGVSMARANNNRKAGWQRMRELLKWCNDHQYRPCEDCREHQQDFVNDQAHVVECEICKRSDVNNGCEHNTFPPQILIQEHCVNLIRTLPNLVHDQKDPEDCNTKGEDHAPDALRYGIMSADVQQDYVSREHGTAYFGANKR